MTSDSTDFSSFKRYQIGDGDFVDKSIRDRLPSILRSIEINDLKVKEWIETVCGELKEDKFVVYDIPGKDGGPSWSTFKNIGKNSAQVDWFFLENYLYRALLEKVDYFRLKIDPFKPQKEQLLEEALSKYTVEHIPELNELSLRKCLLKMLWGNRSDLSLSAGKVEAITQSSLDRLIVDDIPAISSSLLSKSCKLVGIVLDNCGMELCSDLEFVFHVLSRDQSMRVTLFCKSHPVFVSDAIEDDIVWHINKLKKWFNVEEYLPDRLQIVTDDFFTSPLDYAEMNDQVRNKFETLDLIIFKGDANYRRLLGDRVFPISVEFSSVVSYFSTPVVAIRTNKSPIITGIAPTLETNLNVKDPYWRINGKFGIIQFSK